MERMTVPVDPPRDRTWQVVGGITLVGLLLRLWGLGDESFWQDEAWSWWVTRNGIRDTLVATSEKDLHPPLYYLIVAVWTRIGGDSESWLRLPSVVFGTASIPLLFRIGNRLLGGKAAAGAGLLLALSPNATFFSQEARSYALLALLVLVAANLVESSLRGRPLLLGIVLGCIGLTHYVGGLFAAVVAAWLLLRREPRVLAASAGVALAVFAVWIPSFLRQFGSVSAGFWLPAPSPRVLGAALLEWATYPYFLPWVVVGVAGLVLLVATAGGGWHLRRTRPGRLVSAWAAAPILLALVLSLKFDVFYARSLGYVLPAWFLLCAAWPRRSGAFVLAAVALVFIGGQAMMRLTPQKEDWRGAVAFTRRHAAVPLAFWPGDLEAPSSYYLRHEPPRGDLIRLPPHGYEAYDCQREDLNRLLDDAGPDRVWLFTRHRRKHVGDAEFQRFRERFSPSGIEATFQGVLVELWNRRR